MEPGKNIAGKTPAPAVEAGDRAAGFAGVTPADAKRETFNSF